MPSVLFYFTLLFWSLVFQANVGLGSVTSQRLAPRNQPLETGSKNSFFNLDIGDTNGKTLHSPIPTHPDHRGPPSPSVLHKRINQVINDCPRSQIFVSSRCLPDISAKAYEITCSRRHYGDASSVVHTTSAGYCAANQICLQPIRQLEVAYCVDYTKPITIPQISKTDGSPMWNNVQQVVDSGDGPAGSLQFISAALTGSDSQASVFARSLGIQAQAFTMVGGKRIWETLNGGTNECVNCSSVGVQPIPQGTKRVLVNMVLETMGATALLYVEKVTP